MAHKSPSVAAGAKHAFGFTHDLAGTVNEGDGNNDSDSDNGNKYNSNNDDDDNDGSKLAWAQAN